MTDILVQGMSNEYEFEEHPHTHTLTTHTLSLVWQAVSAFYNAATFTGIW